MLEETKILNEICEPYIKEALEKVYSRTPHKLQPLLPHYFARCTQEIASSLEEKIRTRGGKRRLTPRPKDVPKRDQNVQTNRNLFSAFSSVADEEDVRYTSIKKRKRGSCSMELD